MLPTDSIKYRQRRKNTEKAHTYFSLVLSRKKKESSFNAFLLVKKGTGNVGNCRLFRKFVFLLLSSKLRKLSYKHFMLSTAFSSSSQNFPLSFSRMWEILILLLLLFPLSCHLSFFPWHGRKGKGGEGDLISQIEEKEGEHPLLALMGKGIERQRRNLFICFPKEERWSYIFWTKKHICSSPDENHFLNISLSSPNFPSCLLFKIPRPYHEEGIFFIPLHGGPPSFLCQGDDRGGDWISIFSKKTRFPAKFEFPFLPPFVLSAILTGGRAFVSRSLPLPLQLFN